MSKKPSENVANGDEGHLAPLIIIQKSSRRIITLQIINTDFSPYAKPNGYGLTPLTFTIAGNEGLALKVGKCQAGVDTVGFGQTGDIADHVDVPTAFANLGGDVNEHRELLENTYKDAWYNLDPDTQGALCSLSFNAGTFGHDMKAAIKSGDTKMIEYQLLKYNMYKDPQTGEHKVSKGLVVRRGGEAAIIDKDAGKVWDRTVNYYNLLDQLMKSGATPHEIGEMMDGIAKVEIREKGKVVYASNGEIDKTNAIVATAPHTEPVKEKPVVAVAKPEPAKPQPQVVAAKKDEEALKKAFMAARENDTPKPEHKNTPKTTKYSDQELIALANDILKHKGVAHKNITRIDSYGNLYAGNSGQSVGSFIDGNSKIYTKNGTFPVNESPAMLKSIAQANSAPASVTLSNFNKELAQNNPVPLQPFNSQGPGLGR